MHKLLQILAIIYQCSCYHATIAGEVTERRVLLTAVSTRLPGGQLHAHLHTTLLCRQACTGNCRAFDFDSATESCWLHYDDSICNTPHTHHGVTHHAFFTCDLGKHMSDGLIQPMQSDVTSCLNACLTDDMCASVDFLHSTRQCWFHTTVASCDSSALLPLEGVSHFQVKDCATLSDAGLEVSAVRHQCATDGDIMTSLTNVRQCVEACLHNASCAAADFSLVSRMCWHHQSTCKQLVSKLNCNHYRVRACAGSSGDTSMQFSSTGKVHVVSEASEAAGSCGLPRVKPPMSGVTSVEEAFRHSWPWMVALYLGEARPCAGVLVSEQWVITAAHCFSDSRDPSLWSVRLAKHNLSVKEEGEIMMNVSSIHVHSHFSQRSHDHDLALVRLSSAIRSSAHVMPLCLPQLVSLPAYGSLCVTTGWAVTNFASGAVSTSLQQIYVHLIRPEVCNSSSWYNGMISEHMVCAGSESTSPQSCQGDSGGPLVCPINNVWTLVGVSGFGDECARRHGPGVYIRVDMFTSWITENIV